MICNAAQGVKNECLIFFAWQMWLREGNRFYKVVRGTRKYCQLLDGIEFLMPTLWITCHLSCRFASSPVMAFDVYSSVHHSHTPKKAICPLQKTITLPLLEICSISQYFHLSQKEFITFRQVWICVHVDSRAGHFRSILLLLTVLIDNPLL